jgi:phosphate starvation-inducible protein PhoH and related proteins
MHDAAASEVISDKARRRRERKAQKRGQAQASSALVPRSHNQALLIEAIGFRPVVFAMGPEGTGKTYIPARIAMRRLLSGQVEKIIVTRPTAAPTRHRLGFLPGGAGAKLKPWLVPIMDGFKAESSQAQIDKFMTEGKIEIVPFEHMRGRSFHAAMVLLDEGQNATFSDLKLLITRTGEDSTVVISGDAGQTDIEDSGLVRVSGMVARHGLDAEVIEFDYRDVTRSKVAADWVKAFKLDAGPFRA